MKLTRWLFLLVGVICLLLGLAYLINLPGFAWDASSSTWAWGFVVGVFGFSLCMQSIIKWNSPGQLVSSRVTIIALGLAQLLPAVLWWVFRGTAVADAGGVGPLGQWQWSAVHVTVLLLCVYLLILLNKDRKIAA